MTHKALSIFNQLRPVSVGFDNVFDHFEQMFEGDMLSNMPTFPHYNIVKTIKTSTISKSLLLYSKKDIEVNLEEGVLSIKSKKDISKILKMAKSCIKALAKYFSKSFTIADDVEVKGAELKDVSFFKVIYTVDYS